jgi:hypothetical protein
MKPGNSSYLRGCSLAICIAILAWTPAFAVASGLDRSAADIQTGLTKLFGCKWQSIEVDPYCYVKSAESTVILYRDPTGKTVETVEMHTVLVDCSETQPCDVMASRQMVKQAAAYLLPEWKNQSAWLTRALSDAARTIGTAVVKKIIKIGDVTVLVEGFQQADITGTVATVIITKKASLDEWKWGDDTD